tara:strand:- start:604 stop:747 length:144 start_codon:yes stop_codon:yes gene_type:complete
MSCEEQTNNQKHKHQDLTELNSDGNRTRGREGEDLRKREEDEKADGE